MSHKSDDSIEKFFRKAAVQQDKTFMERDWQSMEKMLDDRALPAGSQHAGNSKTILKVTALLFIISSAFFIGNDENVFSENLQVQAVAGALSPRVGARTENPTADLHLLKDDGVKRSTGVNQTVVSVPNIARESDSQRQQDKKQRLKISKQPSATIAQADYSSDAITDSNTNSNALETPAAEFAGQSVSKNQEVEILRATNTSETIRPVASGILLPVKKDVISTGDLLIAEEEVSTPGPVTASSDSLGLQVADQDKSEEIIEDKKGKKEVSDGFPRFNVTALFSPDFSTTSLTRYSKPSGVFGVMAGFKISRRVTITTGATKALKKYEGYGDDYSPPEGYWQNKTNGIVPDEVEGNCGIIEVPLLLQYDISQRARSRFFISAGVSSYFMRSEHYKYRFNEPNPGAANSWTAKSPTHYLFKIGHLSAGYDRSISRHFTVGVEPFLKVPFEGIGWTDINLYSTGAYLNLRYIFSAAPKL